MHTVRFIIVGAGPAGLTAAHEALHGGHAVTVLEQDPEYVGGIARTVHFEGYRFDIGGHRFFSKNERIMTWWRSRLPDDLVRVPRKSRILYESKFYDYPLRAGNVLINMGLGRSLLSLLSYARARLWPVRPERSFEDWVLNRFGRRLFLAFFKSYTEKVWGISTRELSADWAAQRIKGLSLVTAGLAALGWRRRGSSIKTLIDSFEYPRLGPGQMWERVAAEVTSGGGQLELGRRVVGIHHEAGLVTAVTALDPTGRAWRYAADRFLLSMPLHEAIPAFDPPLPTPVLAAAAGLMYRDFITVALVLRDSQPFDDNWIYVHDPAVQVSRIQNFKNWSPALIGEPGTTCLGMEYFCNEGDALWSQDDTALLALGRAELTRLGLANDGQFIKGAVVRMPKAYPVYANDHLARVDIIRASLANFANLAVAGRNGMHQYNNQDHSMLSAMLAVERLNGGTRDPWRVNSDAEYHEECVAPRDN